MINMKFIYFDDNINPYGWWFTGYFCWNIYSLWHWIKVTRLPECHILESVLNSQLWGQWWCHRLIVPVYILWSVYGLQMTDNYQEVSIIVQSVCIDALYQDTVRLYKFSSHRLAATTWSCYIDSQPSVSRFSFQSTRHYDRYRYSSWPHPIR